MRPEVDERSVTVGLVARTGMQVYLMFWHMGATKIVRQSEYYHPTETSLDRLMRVCGVRILACRPSNVQLTAGSGGTDHLSVDIIVRGRLDGGMS
jgi:hypothetical protein